MENVKRTIVRVVTGNKRNQAGTLTSKGAEVVAETFAILQQMDTSPPGSMIAPNAFTIIYYVELGKPYMLLALQGIAFVRGRNGIEGKGKGEKANGTAVMAVHRGSNFAPTRKGADFSYGIS